MSIRYMGVGTSTFQSCPIPATREPLSDWERWAATHVDKAQTPHFWGRFRDYVHFLKVLGCNMFRMSLEPSLCPKRREFNEELMREYVRKFALLRLAGIEPFVTLNHYTMPLHLVRTNSTDEITHGAWENPDALDAFCFFAEHVSCFLGDRDKMHSVFVSAAIPASTAEQWIEDGLVRYVMTINEPAAVLSHGYVTGIFPPHKHLRVLTARKILHKLVAAHDSAYQGLKEALRAQKREVQVGLGYNWQQYAPGLEGKLLRQIEYAITDAFERDGSHTDFIGEQYYCRVNPLLRWPGSRKSNQSLGDYLGWGEVFPAGILEVLKELHARYPKKPLFVTEFGFSDEEDYRRPYWILETIGGIFQASLEGVPIEGVLLWTLVHNLEWVHGMKEHFGLCSESELPKPEGRLPSGIRSWEAWQAAINQVLHSTAETQQRFVDSRRIAARQCRQNGGAI